MTTRELDSSRGVSGYEHQACWRKGGIFHIQMEAPQSCHKKNKFFTIVIDWMTGAIVFVGDGKGEKSLKPFWKRPRGSKAKIKAVATDMASAYYSAVLKNLPNAKHVFDRFHIVKLMLAIAYYLKEDLGQIWQQPNKTIAGRFLKDWCARARASGIKVLQTMANTLEGHRTGILNWYDFPIPRHAWTRMPCCDNGRGARPLIRPRGHLLP